MKGLIHKAALLLGGAVVAVGAGCDTLPKRSADACGIGGCAGGAATASCGGAATGCGGHAGGHGPLCPTALELTGRNNRDLYDRCYPDRYTALARREVNLAFTPQVQNGHVLDQTVWNHYFDSGSERLNSLGQSQLQYIARRRPAPDTTVYLATANDLQYDAACPERFAGARQELDTLRVASVQKYLTALNAGRPATYQVLVHDPGDVSISALPAASSVTQMYGRYRGGLATSPGGGGGSGGGSSGGTAGPAAGSGR